MDLCGPWYSRKSVHWTTEFPIAPWPLLCSHRFLTSLWMKARERKIPFWELVQCLTKKCYNTAARTASISNATNKNNTIQPLWSSDVRSTHHAELNFLPTDDQAEASTFTNFLLVIF